MAQTGDHYYVPHGSHWPIVASVGLFIGVAGAAMSFNGGGFGMPTLIARRRQSSCS